MMTRSKKRAHDLANPPVNLRLLRVKTLTELMDELISTETPEKRKSDIIGYLLETVNCIPFPFCLIEPNLSTRSLILFESNGKFGVYPNFIEDGRSIDSVSAHPDHVVAVSGKNVFCGKKMGPTMKKLSFDSPVYRVAAGGKYFAVASGSMLSFHENETGNMVSSFKNRLGFITACAFAKDCPTSFYSIDNRCIVSTHTVGEDTFDYTEVSDAKIDSIAVSPDGTMIAISNHGEWVKIYKISKTADLTFMCKIETKTSIVNSLCFSPDNQRLIMAGTSMIVDICDIKYVMDDSTPNITACNSFHHACDNAIKSVVYSPDSKLIMLTSVEGEVRMCRANINEESVRPGNMVDKTDRSESLNTVKPDDDMLISNMYGCNSHCVHTDKKIKFSDE